MRNVFISIFWIILVVAPFINHLVYCFTTEKYLLLIAGAIVAPVGWFHGLGLFLGILG